MNAGAYGRDWSDVLIDAFVVDADDVRTLDARSSSGSRTGTRRFGRERSWRRSGSSSSRARPTPVKATRRGTARAAEGDAADEQAHVRQRLQEPGRRAGCGANDRGMRSEGPPDRRRCHLAAPRELHRERRWGDERGLPRVDGRGAQAGARANSASNCSTRCSSSARSSSRPCRGTSGAAKLAAWLPGRGRPSAPRCSLRAGPCPSSRRIAPSGRSILVGPRAARARCGAYFVARETSVFAVRTIDVRGGTPRPARAGAGRARAEVGTSLLEVRRRAPSRTRSRLCRTCARSRTTARSRTRCGSSCGRSSPRSSCAGCPGADAFLVAAAAV